MFSVDSFLNSEQTGKEISYNLSLNLSKLENVKRFILQLNNNCTLTIIPAGKYQYFI